MYWNDEIRNSDVFSYDSMSSCSGSIVGAVYLPRFRQPRPSVHVLGHERTHHDCARTKKKMKNWNADVMAI